jgi:hypothetical protein
MILLKKTVFRQVILLLLFKLTFEQQSKRFFAISLLFTKVFLFDIFWHLIII